jgi:hypothetical protein
LAAASFPTAKPSVFSAPSGIEASETSSAASKIGIWGQ